MSFVAGLGIPTKTRMAVFQGTICSFAGRVSVFVWENSDIFN